MRKTILLYGLFLAGLVWLLKFIDYRFFLREISLEIYVGAIATICTGLGIWMGLRLTRPRVIIQQQALEDFRIDQGQLALTGLSKREYEVLELMAIGLSNQEIADRLFISLNTVKTHASNLFVKLDARRRTQAVKQAQERGLLPPTHPKG